MATSADWASLDDDIEALKAIKGRLLYLLDAKGGRGVELADAIDHLAASIENLEVLVP